MLGWAGNRDFAFLFDTNCPNDLSGMYLRPQAFFSNSNDIEKSIINLQGLLNSKKCIHKSIDNRCSGLVICEPSLMRKLHVDKEMTVNINDTVLFFWSPYGLFFGSKNALPINALEKFFQKNINLAFSEDEDHRVYLKLA